MKYGSTSCGFEGDSWKNFVYQTENPAPVKLPGVAEIGCYHDKGDRGMDKMLVTGGNWANCGRDCPTEEKQRQCAIIAKNSNYRYFSLQWYPGGTECFGGNDLDKAMRHGASTCSLEGDTWKNYIYDMGANYKLIDQWLA